MDLMLNDEIVLTMDNVLPETWRKLSHRGCVVTLSFKQIALKCTKNLAWSYARDLELKYKGKAILKEYKSRDMSI